VINDATPFVSTYITTIHLGRWPGILNRLLSHDLALFEGRLLKAKAFAAVGLEYVSETNRDLRQGVSDIDSDSLF